MSHEHLDNGSPGITGTALLERPSPRLAKSTERVGRATPDLTVPDLPMDVDPTTAAMAYAAGGAMPKTKLPDGYERPTAWATYTW